MKKYYICPKDTVAVAVNHLAAFDYVDLPDGHVLLSGQGNTDRFEQHITVEPLPDLYSPEPISDAHAKRLAPLGIQPGHKTIDVRNAARKLHRLM